MKLATVLLSVSTMKPLCAETRTMPWVSDIFRTRFVLWRVAVIVSLLVLGVAEMAQGQHGRGTAPVIDFRDGSFMTLSGADGTRVAQANPFAPPGSDPPLPAATWSSPGSSASVTVPSAVGPSPSATGALDPAPPDRPPAEPLPADLLSPAAAPLEQAAPAPIPVLDPAAELAWPVDRLFRNLEQQIDDASQREAEQFEMMLQRMQRLQATFAEQQRMLDLQHELRLAREAALAELQRQRELELSAAAAAAAAIAAAQSKSTGPAASGPKPGDNPPVHSDAAPPATDSDTQQIADAAHDPQQASATSEPAPLQPDAEIKQEDGAGQNALELTATVDRAALADNLFAAGKYQLAGKIYLEMLREGLPPDQEAWTRYQLATCYRALGDLASARKHFVVLAGTKSNPTYSNMATWWLAHLSQQERLDARARALRDGLLNTEAEELP